MNDTATSSAAIDQLLGIVEQVARENHPGQAYAVTGHSSFERELGLDSLARVELVQRVGRAFAVELPPQALAEADTPLELLRFLSPRRYEDLRTAALPPQGGAGVPAQAETLLDVLEWHASRAPDRVHILLRDEHGRDVQITHGQLLAAAREVAAGLLAHGLRPHQTVALMLPTGRDYLSCFFGVMLAGAIPVPIYPPARLANIEDHLKRHAGILANAQAALIITVEAGKPVAVLLQAAVPSLGAIVTPAELHGAERLPAQRPGSGDIAFLQYTSGSTGAPKGVTLTHANLLANIRALVQAARAGPDDRFVSWLPLYHDMGLIGAWFGSLYAGIPLVLMSPLAFLARPSLWLEAISRHRGTISAAPNFAYELCARHVGDETLRQLDLSCWRLALNGAEPVSPATLAAFAERFARCGLRREALAPVYGLAESSVGLAFPPPGRGPRIDTILSEPFVRERRAVPAPAGASDTVALVGCGMALPGHELRVVDDTGAELPERAVGRLEFRGPSSTSGYYRNPEATRLLKHGDWLDTGDHAYIADGEVFPAGRVKDLIKRGGRNLYPYDLEQAIGQIPGIRKGCVAVFGSPDPATGSERLVVVAETRAASELDRARLRRQLNETAVDVIGMPPDDIVLAPPHAVLKTSSGKIRRLASREAYEQGTLAQPEQRPWLHGARLATKALLARAKVTGRRALAWLYAGYAWFVFALVLLAFGAPVIALQRPSAGRRIVRAGARLAMRLLGAHPQAHGLECLPREPHILLVNHSSYLDAIMLAAVLPATPGYAFTAKREFARQWWMKRLVTGVGGVFVERTDARRGAEDVDAIVAALRHGERLLVFPEGTFTRESGILAFHSGAFMAAAQASAPVVVAALSGTREALRADSWRPRHARIALEVGPMLRPSGAGWADAVQLREAARQSLASLRGEPLA
ncbi:AMP-binding protein [Massilia solisilvae]|uniref:AMP-binding protein n=1 Tax=Massilia solisilvae TaxID=1811225 RepID=A0ABT2BQQ8_9BURK|nr:AMP-binding protein [Massilia solisilvae]